MNTSPSLIANNQFSNAGTAKIKFGVEVPKNLKDALLLDKRNGDDLWSRAADKEIGKILEHNTFAVHDSRDKMPVDFCSNLPIFEFKPSYNPSLHICLEIRTMNLEYLNLVFDIY